MSRQRLVALRLQISPAPGRGASQRRSVAPGDAGPELRPSIKQSEAAGSHHLPPATTNTGTSMKLLLIIGESSPHRSDNKQRKLLSRASIGMQMREIIIIAVKEV